MIPTPNTAARDGHYAVEALGVAKAFGATVALHDVSLAVRPGVVHAVVGQNGAGKSTLMKILNGVYLPDQGEIRVNDAAVTFRSPLDARARGVGMVFQEFSLVPTLNVGQNISLGDPGSGPLGWIDVVTERERAVNALRRLGSELSPDVVVEELDRSAQQLVEIAKALVGEHHVLILDEPTAAISARDVQNLFKIVRRLAAEGVAIIYISHHLREVLEIAKEVTVLRDGRVALQADVEPQTLETLVNAMLGHRRVANDAAVPGRVGTGRDRPLLEAQDVSVHDALSDVSLRVYPGEVVGIAGLVGSGTTVLLDVLFGLRQANKGSLAVSGRHMRFRHPADAMAHGIALVPKDRRTQGLVSAHSLEANVTLPILKRLTRLFVDQRKANSIAARYVRDLEIVTSGIDANVDSLSGGNQQKVVLAKALATGATILLLEDPNAGVDVATSRDIVRLVRDFVARGNGAIWVSSDFQELATVADRVLVMKRGVLVDEYDNSATSPITEERLLHAVQ